MPTLSPVTFLTQTKDELQKVIWPTRQEIIRLTSVVILVSVMVGLFIGALDFLLTKVLSLLIK